MIKQSDLAKLMRSPRGTALRDVAMFIPGKFKSNERLLMCVTHTGRTFEGATEFTWDADEHCFFFVSRAHPKADELITGIWKCDIVFGYTGYEDPHNYHFYDLDVFYVHPIVCLNAFNR